MTGFRLHIMTQPSVKNLNISFKMGHVIGRQAGVHSKCLTQGEGFGAWAGAPCNSNCRSQHLSWGSHWPKETQPSHLTKEILHFHILSKSSRSITETCYFIQTTNCSGYTADSLGPNPLSCLIDRAHKADAKCSSMSEKNQLISSDRGKVMKQGQHNSVLGKLTW